MRALESFFGRPNNLFTFFFSFSEFFFYIGYFVFSFSFLHSQLSFFQFKLSILKVIFSISIINMIFVTEVF
jgi:hypothetical protein